MLLLILLLVLLFGGCGGWYGNGRWGAPGAAGGFLVPLLMILIICYMLGLFH